MGVIIKRSFWALFWVLLLGFAQYTMPQRDVVRVVSTEIIPNFETNWPMFFSRQDSGTAAQPTRALRLISTVRQKTYLFGLIRAAGDQTMIYRNEDTGWLWPPYFKFDSSDLQSEAEDLRSTSEAPQWAIVTHYGWRIRYLTIYPNAITIRPIDDPDIRLIPWVNIMILTVMGAVAWAITVRWRRFRARRIDPRLERFEDKVDEGRAGMSRWLARWRK